MSDGTADESLPADAHADSAAAFVDRAGSRHGDEIAELYVFGSTVRGEADGRSSDVDVFIVLDDDSDREATADSLRDTALDVMIEYGPTVELHILTESTFDRYQQEGNRSSATSSPRDARMPNDDLNPVVEREPQQSHQALDDATKARDAGFSDSAVINRLYYAAFHAVQAALYDRGFDPTSHGGVRSLFGSEIIAVGDAPREDGRFFSRLGELRQQADYGYGELDANVNALHSRTRELVTDMDALCPSAD